MSMIVNLAFADVGIKCMACKTWFVPSRRSAKYCSTKCCDKHRQEQKKMHGSNFDLRWAARVKRHLAVLNEKPQ